jgi:flavin-binding protein dodecin
MYNFQNATKIEVDDKSFFPVGIIDDVEVVGSAMETSQFDPSKQTLTVIYKKIVNGEECFLRARENEPFKDESLTAEAYNKRCDNQLARMLQILECFYAPEQINITGTDFNSVFSAINGYINRANKSQKVRLKVVYNDRGYIGTSKIGRFIEKMNVEKSKIHLIEKYDLVIRPVIKADEEIKPAF